jgi:hypothetical protein
LPSVRLRWPETTVNVPNDTRHITSRQSWVKALIPQDPSRSHAPLLHNS